MFCGLCSFATKYLWSCNASCFFAWTAIAVIAAAAVVRHKVPTFQFNDKVAVVTGGSMGIGLDIAKLLVSRGCHVYIAARRQEPLDAALKELKAVAEKDGFLKHRNYQTLRFDVSDPGAIRSELKKVFANHGRIDLLVCNAGHSHPARFLDISPEQTRSMMEVNYFGCVNVVREVLPSMHESRSGRIVLTSSMAAAAPVAGFSIYASTKAAIRAFAQSMDMENAPLGVRFQVLNPPDVDTPGYAAENEVKSPECAQICAMGGVTPFSSPDVALQTIRCIEHYSFQINIGFDGLMLGCLSAVMEPPTSVGQLVVQLFTTGLVRFVSAVYCKLHYGICYAVRKEEDKKK